MKIDNDRTIEATEDEETITILMSEYRDLKKMSTCGCGICLAHNNWECPKLHQNEV
jgi:hypothetical protein